MNAFYAVIAYRWGWLNAHQYLVAMCADEETAKAWGEFEQQARAGKYGVLVARQSLPPLPDKESDDYDGATFETVAYYPSRDCENEPQMNFRLRAAERIGTYVTHVVEGDGLLVTPEELAKFVRNEYADAEALAAAETATKDTKSTEEEDG